MSQERKIKPPRIAQWFLESLLRTDERYEKLGDFQETFALIKETKGGIFARMWYWLHVFKAFPSIISNQLYWNTIMFGNYFKITLRNLNKNKGFAFINIFGLAIGMAGSIFILAYVKNELTYDTHHPKVDYLYRVTNQQTFNGQTATIAVTPMPLAEPLKNSFPEIVEIARYSEPRREFLVGNGNALFYEKNLFFADPSILQLFAIPLAQGNPESALSRPQSVVVTRKMAEKYFGQDNPIDKILIINNSEMIVSGVVDKLLPNSFIQFDFLLSMEGAGTLFGRRFLENWGNNNIHTFIELSEEASVPDVSEKLENILQSFRPNLPFYPKYLLQPVKDMHFAADVYADLSSGADMKFIYVLVAVAVSLLFIACVNFMNLSTARSARRASEVGLRKVVGAKRSQLIKQFLGESILISFVAFFLALLVIKLAQPAFNELTGKAITIGVFATPELVLQFTGIALLVGFFAGSYPALFLSAFEPVKVLKGALKSGVKNSLLRKVLVISQYAIATALIISTLIVGKQLNYIQNKDLGFKREQMLVIPLRGGMEKNQYELLKKELQNISGIADVTASYMLPGASEEGSYFYYLPELGQDKTFLMQRYPVDTDFIDTYEIQVTRGRGFSRERFASDSISVLVNESALSYLNLKNPINQTIILGGTGRMNVVGVFKDFHATSLHEDVQPIVLHQLRGKAKYISAKLQSGSATEILAQADQTWTALQPGIPFDYFFLDGKFDSMYREEQKMQRMFIYFSLLTIVISSLGLFGLASFTAEQKAKELGIRKVLGASTGRLTSLLSTDFTSLVLVSNLVAWPVAYYAMDKWLQAFSFRTELGWFVFISGALVSLGIALITISYQTVKAALSNPINALRSE